MSTIILRSQQCFSVHIFGLLRSLSFSLSLSLSLSIYIYIYIYKKQNKQTPWSESASELYRIYMYIRIYRETERAKEGKVN
jgi:hypothetical protein